MVAAWRAIGRLFAKERPALVVGTGGYAAGAALAYAVRHGIPIAEQTGDSLPSLTARLVSRWAREIYLSFPESGRHFRVRSPEVLVNTGAPIEPPPEPRPDRGAALKAWGFAGDTKVVLVSGGSQGSLAINAAVRDWIGAGLPDGVSIIWGTGTKTHEQFAGLESDRVRVRAYLSPIADAYAAADVAIARAGTMTLAELMAWHIPGVLIPLPTAAADHQTLNARTLEQAGAAVHLPQSQLTGASLASTVGALLADSVRLRALTDAAARRARPQAAEDIARRVIALAQAA